MGRIRDFARIPLSIGFADVLVPDAFVTAHLSFKAGDENDEEEEEVRTREREGDGMLNVWRMPSMNENAVTAFVSLHTRLMFLESFLGRNEKVGEREKK